ncbi:MAG: DUF5318 family protein [Acidimicrobiia bacterium]
MRRQIDYRLARRAVLRDWHLGRLSSGDVCDAHPELMRAARHVGAESHSDCPICDKVKLRLVSYVYGDSLKSANGRCISNPAELDRLGTVCDEFACYVVEVCTECSWNHLMRSYLLGRRHAV